MRMKFTPLHEHFVAQLDGIDLRTPPTPEAVREVEQGMDRYGVLVIRGQPLTEEEQLAFTRCFGPLDLGFGRVKKKGGPRRLTHDELGDISNVDVDGKIAAPGSNKVVSNIANQLWHADSSFQRPRARYSMLHAVVLPSRGGETEFCDARAAYDALDDETKARLEGLEAEHFALHSRIMLGDTEYTQEQLALLPPVWWPIVQTHAGSGRKHLFIGAHARAIRDMPLAEARMLLMDLLEHATRPEFVYRHTWQVGDLVIWDNRCILHRGRSYDLSTRRELRRSTTEDVELEVAA
ncbi:MAG: TauD/TfdA family dioxygenase [Burkholderiales bacterium]|nr:MAG: TauD/TfdA family dioxygenase [Burkholderiales bacterium]